MKNYQKVLPKKEKQENKQVKIATREDFERVKKEYGG